MSNENAFAFKAETQKVLKIIINSLYQHKEVFLRELISNSSDALNKIRLKKLTSEKILDSDAELQIELIVDKDNKTLTIRDSGIGMTQKELKDNLGTIAKSGTEEFIEALENKNTDPLIGMFGVGFYSAFLVADKVDVITRSFSPSSRSWEWTSDGESGYSLSSGDRSARGTDIILHLREDYEEYLDDYKIKSIVSKYSNYVEFPIMLGEDKLNDQTALWRVSPNEVTDEQYEEFYQHLGQFGKPAAKIHVTTDIPIEFHAILYIPPMRSKQFAGIDKDWGLRLYNRKVLVEEHNKDLLPEHFRFIVGVVDAEDLDLNVSREVLQNTRMQNQIKKYLQKKIVDELEKLANDDPDSYMDLYREYGPYFKEGIASDDKHKEKLIDLLRFNSTDESGSDGSVTLANYIERMKIGQGEIYYLSGLDLDLLKKSPHLEYYKKEGFEVLLLADSIDSFLMMHLHEYNEKKFFLIDQDEAEEKSDTKDDSPDEDEEDETVKLKTGPYAALLNKTVEVLGSKVTDVKTSDRLVGSVARLVTPKGGISSDMQRAMKIMEANTGGAGINLPMMGKVLQINPDHELIQTLQEIVETNPDDEILTLLIEQIHDNARIADGDTPDFNSMTDRLEQIMLKSIK